METLVFWAVTALACELAAAGWKSAPGAALYILLIGLPFLFRRRQHDQAVHGIGHGRHLASEAGGQLQRQVGGRNLLAVARVLTAPQRREISQSGTSGEKIRERGMADRVTLQG